MSSNSNLTNMRRLVDQLKLEASVERIKTSPTVPSLSGHVSLLRVKRTQVFTTPTVSQAAAELQQYCLQNACKDALLVGVPAGSNPFREPRSCSLL